MTSKKQIALIMSIWLAAFLVVFAAPGQSFALPIVDVTLDYYVDGAPQTSSNLLASVHAEVYQGNFTGALILPSNQANYLYVYTIMPMNPYELRTFSFGLQPSVTVDYYGIISGPGAIFQTPSSIFLYNLQTAPGDTAFYVESSSGPGPATSSFIANGVAGYTDPMQTTPALPAPVPEPSTLLLLGGGLLGLARFRKRILRG